MELYHGTNLIIKEPKLVEQNRFLDFGFGFYTTTNLEQAKSFAKKVVKREGKGIPVVNVYELNENIFKNIKIKKFEKPNEDWLDFVAKNRNGDYHGEHYDLIIVPVANDDVYRTLQLYLSNILSKEQTLEILKIKELYNQYVFATDLALKQLKYIESIEVK